MRALVLHWGRTGGGPRFAVDAVAALEAAGAWVAYSSSSHSERSSTDREVGALHHPVPTFRSAAGFALGAPRAVRNGYSLRAFVERNRIDCVFAAMEQLWQPAAAVALRRSSTPYLLGLHDGRFHLGEESRVRRAARRAELAFSDGVMTFSRSATSDFLETVDYPHDRVWTSFLPARAVAAAPDADESPDHPFRFGFFGRLVPYKGIGLLLEAVRRMSSVDPRRPFEVEIWGQGAEAALDASDLPAEVRVMRRWVAEDDVEAVLRRFDAIVAPYVEASQSGVIPLAASLGIPALVTPVGGLAEQVADGSTGLVASAVDGEAFSTLMRRALDDPDGMRALGRGAARRLQEDRSIARFGDDLAGAMEQLVRTGKRRR